MSGIINIREYTSQDTVMIARRPGVQLSALVGRSMYVPSALDGGHIPGYNLNHVFHLVHQRGYPTELHQQRLEMVETLYVSRDEAQVKEALHQLKELQRPLAIHYASRDTYSLGWLETRGLGRVLVSEGTNTVWLVDDPSALPGGAFCGNHRRIADAFVGVSLPGTNTVSRRRCSKAAMSYYDDAQD
jgi:hypothetical protein